MSITFPSAAELNGQSKADVSSLAYDFTRVCFAIDVSSADIPKHGGGTCDIPVSLFQGFVPPGATISIDVPRGTGRHLEIYALTKNSATDPCPGGRGGIAGMDLTRLARVGTVNSFDTMDPEVNVDVTISQPTANLASQSNMPLSCTPKPIPSAASSAIVAGRAVQSGGAFKIVGTVSGLKNEVQLQGGAYRMRMSRREQ